jgi:hypothetical protein
MSRTLEEIFNPYADNGKKIDFKYGLHWGARLVRIGDIRIIDDSDGSILSIGRLSRYEDRIKELVIGNQSGPNHHHTNAPVRLDRVDNLHSQIRSDGAMFFAPLITKIKGEEGYFCASGRNRCIVAILCLRDPDEEIAAYVCDEEMTPEATVRMSHRYNITRKIEATEESANLVNEAKIGMGTSDITKCFTAIFHAANKKTISEGLRSVFNERMEGESLQGTCPPLRDAVEKALGCMVGVRNSVSRDALNKSFSESMYRIFHDKVDSCVTDLEFMNLYLEVERLYLLMLIGYREGYDGYIDYLQGRKNGSKKDGNISIWESRIGSAITRWKSKALSTNAFEIGIGKIGSTLISIQLEKPHIVFNRSKRKGEPNIKFDDDKIKVVGKALGVCMADILSAGAVSDINLRGWRFQAMIYGRCFGTYGMFQERKVDGTSTIADWVIRNSRERILMEATIKSTCGLEAIHACANNRSYDQSLNEQWKRANPWHRVLLDWTP